MADDPGERRAFRRRLIGLSLPIAFQSLMLALVAAADAFMLGIRDQDAMAAVSLATQVQFIQTLIVFAMIGGLSVLGSQYWGKGDDESVGRVFRITVRSLAAASLLFSLACVFVPRTLMQAFTGSETLVSIGAGYLRIAGWSYFFTGISQSFHGLLKVSGRATQAAAVSGATVLLDIALNAVFIFGLAGCPALGARGAAWATLLARAVELAVLVFSVSRTGPVRPHLSRCLESYPELAADFRKCVSPILGACILWGVGFSSYTAVMGHLGEDAAAANAIAAVVRDLTCCVVEGVAAASGILVANELGAGRLARGRLYGARLARLSVLLGLACTAVVLLVTPVVLHTVVLTPVARRLLLHMMLVLSVYQIGRYVNTIVINGVFTAGGDTLFDFYSLIACMWGLAVPLAFLGAFVFHWPVVLVYACTCVDEVGKLPWVYAHYKRYLWVRNLTRKSE